LNIRQPFQKQRQNQLLPFYILFHKLISVRVAVAAINISIFLLQQMTRMSSASSNTKLVKYNGTECSKYWVRSNWYGWLQFQNQILLHSCS
jgi:hypothetical protein